MLPLHGITRSLCLQSCTRQGWGSGDAEGGKVRGLSFLEPCTCQLCVCKHRASAFLNWVT